MIIFPAIDLMDGKCVRLTQGSFNASKVYHKNPLDAAKLFEDAGLKYLHLVDLDGAKNSKPVHLNILEDIAAHTHLIIDFGGGLSKKEHLANAFNAGADRVNIGSAAVKFPLDFADWMHFFGAERIILSADVRNELVQINGWQDSAALSVYDILHEKSLIGLQFATITDVLKDGMLQGVSGFLYQNLVKTFPDIKMIASGGVTNLDDLSALKNMGCYGAIVGKAIYESKFSLSDLTNWMQNA